MGRIGRVVQTSTVSDNQHRFESLETKAHGMSGEVKRQMYITGLKPGIQVQLVKARLVDISEAFALASVCEE